MQRLSVAMQLSLVRAIHLHTEVRDAVHALNSLQDLQDTFGYGIFATQLLFELEAEGRVDLAEVDHNVGRHGRVEESGIFIIPSLH